MLIFTDKQQCYKPRLAEFEDTKASALGDYLPTKLGMDPDEKVVWACLPGDYAGDLVLFFANGKVARVPLAAYQTQSRRKKLTGAYSDKSPLVAVLWLKEDQDLAVTATDGRTVVFDTSLLAPKATRTTQGVGVMNLKAGQTVAAAAPLAETGIKRGSRYPAEALPAGGATLPGVDKSD